MTHPAAGQQVCYRHPERPAYIQCQRCERFICPEDMREASVGFQCPECVAQGQQAVRQPRTLAGGTITANSGIVTLVIIVLNLAAHFVVIATGGVRNSPVFDGGAMLGLGYYDGALHGVAISVSPGLSALARRTTGITASRSGAMEKRASAGSRSPRGTSSKV